MAVVPKPDAPTQLPRKASREVRRLQLIEATIETLAQRGYARITLSDVAATAGLSHGLVNFHFKSKEQLLTETLLFLAEEYRVNWTSALAAAANTPAARLEALLRADFNEAVYSPNRLKAWCAFWGEAQSRPIYQEKCGSNDLHYVEVIESICADLNSEGGYRHDVVQVARILRVTVEGLWLDMITTTATYPPDEALRTVFTCAAALFPRHFSVNGLLPEAGPRT